MFTSSVRERLGDWCDAIRAMLTNIQALQDQAADLIDKVQDSKVEASNLRKRINQNSDLLKSSQNEAKRLQLLRDEYRNEADDRAKEIETL